MTLIDRRNEWYAKRGPEKVLMHQDRIEAQRLNDLAPDAAYRAQIAAEELAREIGITQGAISQWLTRGRIPVERVRAIEILMRDIWEVLGYTKPKDEKEEAKEELWNFQKGQ